MILANIEAQIEAKIEKLKVKKSHLLDKDTNLYYEIEELKENLTDEL